MGAGKNSVYDIDGRQRERQPYERALARREALEARRRDWKKVVLREYAACGNVTKACKRADIPPKTLYAERRKDPEFAEAWDLAHKAATDKVLEAVWEIGVEGVREPIVFQGEIVGYTRRKDFKAAKFLLEAMEPATYSQRERVARMQQLSSGELAARRDQLLADHEARLNRFFPKAELSAGEVMNDGDDDSDDDGGDDADADDE